MGLMLRLIYRTHAFRKILVFSVLVEEVNLIFSATEPNSSLSHRTLLREHLMMVGCTYCMDLLVQNLVGPESRGWVPLRNHQISLRSSQLTFLLELCFLCIRIRRIWDCNISHKGEQGLHWKAVQRSCRQNSLDTDTVSETQGGVPLTVSPS